MLAAWDWGEWLGVAGLVVGIIGIGTGIWAYQKTKNVQRLKYSLSRRYLISKAATSSVQGRIITVDGREVDALYRDYILLYSAGNRSFRFSDHVNSIRYEIEAENVVRVGVLFNDDSANDAQIEFSEGVISLRLDYLRSGDGVLYYVDHTNDESRQQLAIEERERDVVARSLPLFGLIREITPLVLAQLVAFIIIMLPFVLFSNSETWEGLSRVIQLLLSATWVCAAVAGFIVSARTYKKYLEKDRQLASARQRFIRVMYRL
ncbi:hypothetical protein [Jiella pelagia]|uniref:DUF3592 domain-containing protein n=1 Tax=Jiella pelagia TaxID=2986949 RepID=A0ABY7C2F6_9HYPH|nr:hypothetical protein [Jiella pelagia]WAP69055.1 hypothetical protein OH818_01590 [Jiella pelagia]